MSDTYNVGCVGLFFGAPDVVTDYLWDTDNLRRHVPHVQDLEHLTASSSGKQLFRMQLCPPGAAAAQIVTVRTREHCRIKYVQLQTHPLLRSHEGEWLVSPDPAGNGSLVYLNHRLRLDEAKVEQARPRDAVGTAWALDLVRQSGRRSLAALSSAFSLKEPAATARGSS